jgi:hypothetical protein
MTLILGKPLIHLEFLAVSAVCWVLLMVTLISITNPLWSIPAISLFALTGVTLLLCSSRSQADWRS